MIEPEAPGLYIHVPFCRSRCGYCTFTSGVYNSDVADAYIAALQAEIAVKKISTPSTIFIGGGTPTVLTPAQLATLLSGLPRPGPDAEFTCEINPDTATVEKLALLQDYGVNRLSIGVQTFSDDGLRLLGRCHDKRCAVRAIEKALEMGFSNVNLDLIHGWPGQDGPLLLSDLEQAVSIGTHHLSTYSLIIEESAPRYDLFITLLSDEESDSERFADFFATSHEFLTGHGFTHYETSNYAKPGHICRHNWNIWRGGEYWGVGLAAHSHRNGRRYANTSDMAAYLRNAGSPTVLEAFSEVLESVRKARETAVFWLRLYEGVELQRFQALTGMDFFSLYGDTGRNLVLAGMLELSSDGRYIRVPLHYHPVLDSILVDLV